MAGLLIRRRETVNSKRNSGATLLYINHCHIYVAKQIGFRNKLKYFSLQKITSLEDIAEKHPSDVVIEMNANSMGMDAFWLFVYRCKSQKIYAPCTVRTAGLELRAIGML